MKRIFAVFLALTFAFCLISCDNKPREESTTNESSQTNETAMDVVFEANEIIKNNNLSGGSFYTHNGETLDDDLILSYFGDATASPDFSVIEEYALYIDETKPINPCEFGIFKLKSDGDGEAFVKFLQARIQMKINNAAAYPDMDTQALTTAKFTVENGYVWYAAVKGANDQIDEMLKGKV